MLLQARFVHTNIVARDWRKLADFYEGIFGCKPVPPERNLSGSQLEAATGVPGAELRGIHLRLPGYGEEGPTLEIFSYNRYEERPATAVNRPGIAHIAFLVNDVSEARRAVLEAGGAAVGETATLEVGNGARVTFCYMCDPEGNILELQSWSGG